MQSYLIFDYRLKLDKNVNVLDSVSTLAFGKGEEREKVYRELNREDNFREMVVDILNYVNS